MLVAGMLISPSLVAWMSPTIAGLILAIFRCPGPAGSWSIGVALKKVGLLVTPEETQPAADRDRAPTHCRRRSPRKAFDHADGLRAIYEDPQFREAHETFLPPAAPRVRGDIHPDRAMAEAKLNDAETIDDAVKWLQRKERMVLLHDRALIGLLSRLPSGA